VFSLDEVILLKLGEVVLKGLNRNRFEGMIIHEAVRRIAPFGRFSVVSRQSVITVTPEGAAVGAGDAVADEDVDVVVDAVGAAIGAGAGAGAADMDGAYAALSHVFGIMSLVRAAQAAKGMEEIIQAAISYLTPVLSQAATFKAEARRADKNYPLTSPEIARRVGGALHKAFGHLSVDVKNPDVTVMIEIRETHAYIHADAALGAGGLPPGSGGRAVLLLSGGIDSPVAGYMMAKRGLGIIPVHFFSYPYTSKESLDKVKQLARLLGAWTGRASLKVVPFTAIQEAIRRQCPDGYATLIGRRFMMEIAGRLAHNVRAGALVTGESLGQVASQTLESLVVTGQAAGCPVLRPLIGMDKEEIVTQARKIGTFETSILPYDDCCTVFTPRRPKTKPRMQDVLAAEAPLDREALITEALSALYVDQSNL